MIAGDPIWDEPGSLHRDDDRDRHRGHDCGRDGVREMFVWIMKMNVALADDLPTKIVEPNNRSAPPAILGNHAPIVSLSAERIT